jgi:hypothetical protein
MSAEISLHAVCIGNPVGLDGAVIPENAGYSEISAERVLSRFEKSVECFSNDLSGLWLVQSAGDLRLDGKGTCGGLHRKKGYLQKGR